MPSAGEAPPRLDRMRWWHLEPVTRLERQVFGATAWSAETFWSELARPDRWYVVAVPARAPAGGDGAGEHQVLGYAGLMDTGGQADVQTIAVAPHARGQGLGAVLLHALLAEGRARGATSVMLEVRADNQAAVGLYQRFGFERLSVRRRYYQPGDVDAWVMRLRPLRVGTA